MDSAVVRQKLASIERCVRRIAACQAWLGNSIDDDPDAHDSVALNLVCAIGLSADVALHLISGWGDETPSTMAASFKPLATRRVLTREAADELRRGGLPKCGRPQLRSGALDGGIDSPRFAPCFIQNIRGTHRALHGG